MPPRINIPPITRALLIFLLVQSTLSFGLRLKQWNKEKEVVLPYLTLVPSISLIYPWVFLTSTLVESNVFTLGITGATIFYGGRYLERAWSSVELAKFLVVVTLIPNLLCFLTLVLFFALTKNVNWTLTPIAGGISLQIAFLVAFSQLVPAHTVTLFRGIVSLRVLRFPLIYLLLVTILSLTPIFTSASFFLATFGFLVSWTYLRFYKTAFPDLDSSQPSSLRGDASETFAFAEFFPEPIKGPVSTLSTIIFNILVTLHICAPFSAAEVSASRGDAYTSRTVPTSARAETERRRALALKALDQRLHAATAATAGTAKVPQPQTTLGHDVSLQPKPSTQTAMTSQPASMLGETSYVPEREGDGEKGGMRD